MLRLNYREYSIILQLHMQQKIVGSEKVGLSNNEWVDIGVVSKKSVIVKNVGLSSVRLSNILCICFLNILVGNYGSNELYKIFVNSSRQPWAEVVFSYFSASYFLTLVHIKVFNIIYEI